MYPDLPLEFVVTGTAVSAQGSTHAESAWIEQVRETAKLARGADRWALETDLAVTLYYFPDGKMQGDIDNIAKPVLDGLSRCIFIDDRQVERLVIQRFEGDRIFPFSNPSRVLADAMAHTESRLYVKVTDDLHGDLE